jgi:hypothetical protein
MEKDEAQPVHQVLNKSPPMVAYKNSKEDRGGEIVTEIHSN